MCICYYTHSQNKQLLHLEENVFRLYLDTFQKKRSQRWLWVFYPSLHIWAKIQHKLIWYWQWRKSKKFNLKAELFMKYLEIKINQMPSLAVPFLCLGLGKPHNHSINDKMLITFQQNPGQSAKKTTLALWLQVLLLIRCEIWKKLAPETQDHVFFSSRCHCISLWRKYHNACADSLWHTEKMRHLSSCYRKI